MLYPLKFKLQNGKRISDDESQESFLADLPEGENWEIAGGDEEPVLVANGFLEGNSLADAIEIYMNDLVGDRVFQECETFFPFRTRFSADKKNFFAGVHPDLANDAPLFEWNAVAQKARRAKKNAVSQIASNAYYTINYLSLDKTLGRDYYILDSFVILVCLSGVCEVKFDGGYEFLKAGESALVPAELCDVLLKPAPACELLEMYVAQDGQK